MALNLELYILTGCDGSGKSTIYNNIMDKLYLSTNNNNIMFRRFPTVDTRDVISQVSNNEFITDILYTHKLFEVDFHNFFEEFNNETLLKLHRIDIKRPIKVLMDRFFPCNMAYALYHTDNNPSVIKMFDFLKHFINKEDNPDRRLKINILHVTPNTEKWLKLNGETMSKSFLSDIEKAYQNVYNYLQENYNSLELEKKGITSLKISKFYNNYDGNVEKEIRNCAIFPKV